MCVPLGFYDNTTAQPCLYYLANSLILTAVSSSVYQMVALQASEHEKEVREVNFGLDQTRQELAEVTRRENALVRQQTSMSVEMVAEGKARRAAEEEVRLQACDPVTSIVFVQHGPTVQSL